MAGSPLRVFARMTYMEYEYPTVKPYYDLMELLQRKNYHIITTNQDFQFTRVVPEKTECDIGRLLLLSM